MALENMTYEIVGGGKTRQEEEQRKKKAEKTKQKSLGEKTAVQTPNPAGVLPAASQQSFATLPQNDRKFLEYTVQNKAAQNAPKEQTLSQAQYNVEHQQWLIDQAKKNGANVTWNQALPRVLNRAAQNFLAATNGVSSSANQAGQDWAKRNNVDTNAWARQARADLQNTEIGRQNAYITTHQAIKRGYQDAADALLVNQMSGKAMSNPDFTTYSKYDPNKGNDKDFDSLYERVNQSYRVDDSFGDMLRYAYKRGTSDLSNDTAYDPVRMMTGEEKAVFNYLYNKNGREVAERYYNALLPDLNNRSTEKTKSDMAELATANIPAGAAMTAAAVPFKLAGDFAATGQAIGSLFTGKPIDQYRNFYSDVAEGIRGGITDKLQSENHSVLNFLYQTGNSILDSTARAGTAALLGGGILAQQASLLPMAAGVYQSEYKNALAEGRSPEDAQLLGGIAAGAEWLTEMVELDDLFRIMKEAPKTPGRALWEAIKHGAVEGTEELESNAINAIADVLVLGDESDWSRAVKKYQDEGKSLEDSVRSAFIDKAVEAGLDYLGGFISGGAGGLGAVGVAGVRSSVEGAANRQNRADEQAKAKTEQVRQQVEAAQAEAKESADLSAEQWEASRKDQSDAAKKRRAALRASAAEHGVDEETIRTMEAVSDTTGRNYVWYTKPATDYGVEDGYFDEKAGDVHINTESKQPLSFVIAHELTHSTEGAAVYKTLRDFALRHLREAGVDVDALRERRTADYDRMGAKNVDIDGEIVADYVGRNLLDNASEIENLVNARHDAAQRVWNWINDRLTRIAGDGSLREKALLTRAQELYGRALAQSRPEAPAQAAAGQAQAPAQAQNTAAPAAAPAVAGQQAQAPAAAQAQAQTGTAEGLQPPAAGEAAQAQAPAQTQGQAQNAPAPGNVLPAAGSGAETEEDLDDSDDEVSRMQSMMRGADLTDEEGNAKYSVTPKDVEETREYIESLPEQKKFSVSTPVEKVKTDSGDELIAVHNVDPADFLHTMERYDGFPAWSLAVMKPGTKHNGFGRISVVFKRSAADPQADSRNKLYAGDAWTGTFGSLTPDEMANADAEYVANKIGNKTPRRLDIPTFSSLAEAKASGLLMNESERSRLKEKILELRGIAERAARRPDEYMAAATKTLSRGILDAIDDETLREECRAAYDAMSDAQREYIVAMKEYDSAREEWNNQGGEYWEQFGIGLDDEEDRRFGDLEDRIIKLSGRIDELYELVGNVEDNPFAFDPDTMTADDLRDAVSTYLTDKVHNALLGTAIDTANGSDAAAAYRENTADAAGFVKRLLDEYEDIGLDIVSNYSDIRNSSEPVRKGAVEKWRQLTERDGKVVKYFEAKPARVLGFGEVAGVALPTDHEFFDDEYIPRIKEILDEKGINYEYYGTGKYDPDSINAPDSRADVVNRIADMVEGAKFSVSPIEEENVNSLNDGETVTDDHGDTVADSDGKGHVRFSLSTYDESGRALMDNWLNSHVKSGDLTAKDADDIRNSMERMYQICSEYSNKYGSFGAWSEAKVVSDEKGNPVFSVVLPNSEYTMNIDFSTICKKRRALNAALNELIDRGVLDSMELDQENIVKINQILDKHDFEIGCAICFVEAKRFRQASIVDSFVTLYNDMVRSMYPEGTKLGYHDYAGQQMRSDYSDIKPDFTHLDEVMRDYGSKTVEYKTASYLKRNASARRLLNRSDFMTDRGIMAMRADKTGQRINSLYNSKKGTGGPKSSLGDMQYNHEIIGSRTRTFDRERAYAAGGVRIQSFSDYVAHMVFDYMEMVADLTAKKLPAHSYTKEGDFAKLFGLTGIKINMSLVPRFVDGGVAPGLDENGDYAWDKESFDYDLALQIENADGYGENCGTIAVGVSDEHIRKLLADPNIRMVIPYHKSSLNPIVAEMMHIAAYSDYTDYQRTRGKDGKFLEKEEFNFNKELHDDPNATPQSVAEKYIRWCEDNGYTPKFPQFAYIEHEGVETLNDEGKKAVNPNYYKLLEDFTLFDSEGAYHPQGDVRMRFPGENDAFGSYQSLIEDSLRRDNETYERLGSEIPGIADEIIDTLGTGEKTSGKGDIKRSVTPEENAEYMKAAEAGDEETAGRMVEEAARNAGYILAVPDRKYSISQEKLDEYDEAFNEGNEDWMEQVALEAATENGYRMSGLHGSPISDIKVFNTHSQETKKQKLQLLFGTHFTWVRQYAELYTHKAKNSKGTSHLTRKAGKVYHCALDLGKSLDLKSSEQYQSGSEMWDLYQDLPANIKKKHKPETYSEYDTQQGLGEGEYINARIMEDALQDMSPFDAEKFLRDHNYNSVLYIARYFNGMPGIYSKDPSIIMLDENRIKSVDPITYDDDGKIIPLSERFNRKKNDIRYSISTDLDRLYPGWNDNSTTSSGRDNTQIAGTISTYRRIGQYLEQTDPDARILDASSGLGLGTQDLKARGFDIDDVEPFPSDDRRNNANGAVAPTYTDYADIPEGSYDVVISNAVLNVIPDDWRDDVVDKMAKAVAPGGKLIVNVRDAAEVAKIPSRIPLENDSEILVTQNGKPRHYQKGFTQSELENYLRDRLGDGWTVEKAKPNNSGLPSGSRAVVAVKDGNNRKFSVTPNAPSEQDNKLQPKTAFDTVQNLKNQFGAAPQPQLTDAQKELTDKDRAQMSREAPVRSEREMALDRAAAEAFKRHNNADITVPSANDTAGQKQMFDTQYQAARKFNRAMDRHKLSKTDMALVRDLMAGVKTPEYDYGEADSPAGVQEVFEALVEADRASRAVEAYKDAIHEDLHKTAAGMLEHIDKFNGKGAGIFYARETQERNIRDIAPEADAEAIVAEYFDPVHVHTMQAKELSDEYTRRVNALKIDTKRRHGNKDSENVAIQFMGEVESIIAELEQKTNAFNRRVESQSRKSHGRYGGADAAVQSGLGTDPYAKQPRKYGMTLDEYREALEKFKKDNPKLNYDEIHRKIAEMQKIYGELYDRLNEVYMRWGYPPMGKIKNYFPHFLAHEDNILTKIGGVLGFDQSAQKLPAYLAGLTKDFRPGRQWFANALRRMTNYTEYDTLRGFDRYIQKAADIIYHTEDIQKLRSYVNTIRYLSTDAAMEEKITSIRKNKTLSEDEKQTNIAALFSNKAMTKYNLGSYAHNLDEYINTELANKRSDADRWLEDHFGRSMIYGAAKAYQRLRVRSAVQGNITSALTNIIPIAQVSGVAGLGNTTAAYLQTIGNMVKTMFHGTDTLREGSVFLKNREDYESVIPKTLLNRLGDVASFPFAVMDRLGSETVWRALYNYNRRHGMSHETASALADKRAADIVADRSKGALPTLFMAHNPLINMFTRFMLEQNNTVSYLTKDVPRYFQGRPIRTGLAYGLIALLSWLYNEGFEALFGRRPAQDPLGIANDLAGDISGYKMPNVFKKGGELISEGRLPTAEDFRTERKTVGGTIKNTAENVIDQAPFTGLIKTILVDIGGVDLDLQGGRFEVSDAAFDYRRIKSAVLNEAPKENMRQLLAEELSKPVTGLMPGGNQIQKSVKGVATLIAGGSYKINDKGERLLQYPAEKTPGNWAKAAIAGKSALPTAQEWVAKGFDTLNAKDTALYDTMTGAYGVKPKEALALIKGLNDVKKTDTESKAQLQRRMLIDSKVNQDSKLPIYQTKGLSTDSEDAVIDELGPENINELLDTFDQIRRYSKDYQKIQVLRSADLSRDTKQSIYTNLVTKNDQKKIDAALQSGLSFGDYLDIAHQYKAINQEDISEGAKATEFAKWLDGQRYTDEQKSTIKETNKYWQSIPAQASNYEKLTGAGLSSDQAYDLYEQLDALEPLTGAKSVSHAQKWDVIINSGLSTAEQLDVIKAVSYDGEYYDFKISNDYGVDPKGYKAFLDSMPKYDADGNGSYKQAEIKAALDAASGLTVKQKAAIWQLNGSSTTAKNNPYSTDVGNYVLQMLKDMKAQTEKEKASASTPASSSSSSSAGLNPPRATVPGATASGTSSSASTGSGKTQYTPNFGLPRG